ALGQDGIPAKPAALEMLIRKTADVVTRPYAHAVDEPVFLRAASPRFDAQRFGEARPIRARAVHDDVVDPRQQIDVDVHMIQEKRIEDLAQKERRARSAGRLVVPRLADDAPFDLA